MWWQGKLILEIEMEIEMDVESFVCVILDLISVTQ